MTTGDDYTRNVEHAQSLVWCIACGRQPGVVIYPPGPDDYGPAAVYAILAVAAAVHELAAAIKTPTAQAVGTEKE